MTREMIEDVHELFKRLREGHKVYHEHWPKDDFMIYDRSEGAVIDESGTEMNITILMNNWDAGAFYVMGEPL